MAQQTQIARVGPAWEAFLGRFPTARALAEAPVAEVLRAWRGLGYNSRALNLQRAARAIVDEHGGRVPDDPAILERLPGVGPYTARAVAAIAHGRPVGAVDTNVRRVLSRLVVGDRAGIPARPLQMLADAAVPSDRPGAWTHALMDLGATLCRPARPGCVSCPLRPECRYAATGGALEGAPPADDAPARRRATQDAPAFPATTRWLRGRILDRARDVRGGDWAVFDGPLGLHPHEAVVAMLSVLARQGLLEVSPDEPILARLPDDGPRRTPGPDGRDGGEARRT